MSSSYKFINCVSEDDSPVHNHIPQYHTVIADPTKIFPYLLQLISHDQLVTGGKSKIIIFFSTTRTVQLFSEFITGAASKVLPSGRKTRVYEMHSKRDMDRRMAVSKHFRNDNSGASILVTSDVSARGVDYPGVSRVIQMGLPASGDMYIHRVGRTGRGDNKTGRGDLILCSWEMGFLKRQLRSVPIQPLIMSDLQKQTRELAAAKDEEIAGGEPQYVRQFEEIEPLCRSIATSVPEDEAHGVFMSQVGFYVGHYGDMGLNKAEVLSGLQHWTQELFGLESPPRIPHSAQMRMGILSESHNTPTRSTPNYRSTPSRASAPWMGRGSRSSPSRERATSGSRSDTYGERSGGYGSSSYGSRDSSKGSYTPRSSQYGSRDSNDSYSSRNPFGSRDSNSSYTPRASYGSRDSNSYSSGAPTFGSRDARKSGKPSKYGSRDSSKYGSRESAKYGSRNNKSSSSSYDWQ